MKRKLAPQRDQSNKITKFFKTSPSQEVKKGIPCAQSPSNILSCGSDVKAVLSPKHENPSPNNKLHIVKESKTGVVKQTFSPRRTRSRIKVKNLSSSVNPKTPIKLSPSGSVASPKVNSPNIVEAFKRAEKKLTGICTDLISKPVILIDSDSDDVILLDPVDDHECKNDLKDTQLAKANTNYPDKEFKEIMSNLSDFTTDSLMYRHNYINFTSFEHEGRPISYPQRGRYYSERGRNFKCADHHMASHHQSRNSPERNTNLKQCGQQIDSQHLERFSPERCRNIQYYDHEKPGRVIPARGRNFQHLDKQFFHNHPQRGRSERSRYLQQIHQHSDHQHTQPGSPERVRNFEQNDQNSQRSNPHRSMLQKGMSQRGMLQRGISRREIYYQQQQDNLSYFDNNELNEQYSGRQGDRNLHIPMENNVCGSGVPYRGQKPQRFLGPQQNRPVQVPALMWGNNGPQIPQSNGAPSIRSNRPAFGQIKGKPIPLVTGKGGWKMSPKKVSPKRWCSNNDQKQWKSPRRPYQSLQDLSRKSGSSNESENQNKTKENESDPTTAISENTSLPLTKDEEEVIQVEVIDLEFESTEAPVDNKLEAGKENGIDKSEADSELLIGEIEPESVSSSETHSNSDPVSTDVISENFDGQENTHENHGEMLYLVPTSKNYESPLKISADVQMPLKEDIIKIVSTPVKQGPQSPVSKIEISSKSELKSPPKVNRTVRNTPIITSCFPQNMNKIPVIMLKRIDASKISSDKQLSRNSLVSEMENIAVESPVRDSDISKTNSDILAKNGSEISDNETISTETEERLLADISTEDEANGTCDTNDKLLPGNELLSKDNYQVDEHDKNLDNTNIELCEDSDSVNTEKEKEKENDFSYPRCSQESFSFILGGDDSMSSDDSSDEDLPTVLKALDGVCNRPVPATPTKEIDKSELPPSESPELECGSSQDLVQDQSSVGLSRSSTKFSLDDLLAERIDQEEGDRELLDIEQKLKERIKLGGVDFSETSQDESATEDDLMPEHRLQLKELRVCEEAIQETHPGDQVFDSTHFQQLFDYPATLSLSQCGFVPGPGRLDQALSSLNPDNLLDFLSSNIVLLCFKSISCPNAFLSWLFQLMSIHQNSLVIQSCHQIFYGLLTSHSTVSKWVPSLTVVFRVFMNYGATLNSLCPTSQMQLTLQGLLSDADVEKLQSSNPVQQNANQYQDYSFENMQHVLKTLTEYVSFRPQSYSADDLTSLALMVFRVSIDSRLNQEVLKFDCQLCLSVIVLAFPDNQWKNKMLEMCEEIPQLSSHHHNLVYMVQLVPTGPRGAEMQRRLAYACLYKLQNPDTTIPKLESFPVSRLFELVANIQVRGDGDFYLTASLISLVDLYVGNETPPSSERSNLQNLTEMIRSLMGDVRENISKLDRTRVKDMMVRLTSKWNFMFQNMGSTQRTLFGFAYHQPAPLQEQQVMCQQDDDSEVEPDTEAETQPEQPISNCSEQQGSSSAAAVSQSDSDKENGM